MLDKHTLTLKLNKSFLVPDAPFTPVEQTLGTPLEQPGQESYFGHMQRVDPQYSESEDILTDVDEPRVNRSYTIAFTPAFDTLLTSLYTHIVSLPTTTPFQDTSPPLGIVSRVANETFSRMLKNALSDDSVLAAYDAHSALSVEHLRSPVFQPVILQLIRKRLIDICAAERSKQTRNPAAAPPTTSVLVPMHAPAPGNNNPYHGLGWRQLSISNLLLNEQNISTYLQSQQNPQGLAAASSQHNATRLRSSSLNLRKHSLTRNNSSTGSNWLHVGNLAAIRPLLGTNREHSASLDSLQLMHDFAPHAFISRLGSTLSILGATPVSSGGYNPLMMDYPTPHSSNHGLFSQSSTSGQSTCGTNTGGSFSESDGSTTPQFYQLRSLSRNGFNCSLPYPLTINTDLHPGLAPGLQGSADVTMGETLHSPFVSAITPSEDCGYFPSYNMPGHVLGNILDTKPTNPGVRHSPLISEPVQDANKMMPISLSEKKRDSLKLKRGIH